MRGLTVRPPWSHALIFLGKHTENRTNAHRWRGLSGETIAIHAGLRWDQHGVDDIEAITGAHLTDCDVDRGAIIGTARVVDVHWSDGDCCDPWGQHGPGICHLSIDNPRPCDPIPMRGALGLWRVPDDAVRLIETVRS